MNCDRSAHPLGGLALLAALLVSPQPAGAMVIDCGPSICFEYDENQAGVGSFGLPVRVGDSMQFLPAALRAESTGGGLVSLASSFEFSRIYAVGGGELLAIELTEQGDYEIIGAGSVSATLGVTAFSNLAAEQALATGAFTATGDSGSAQLWSAAVSVAPAAAFAGFAADVRFVIENVLGAGTATIGDLAWIQKKFVVVTVESAAPVPLPGSLLLLGSSAGVLGWLVPLRRRGAAARRR